jgi:hypothetical protein
LLAKNLEKRWKAATLSGLSSNQSPKSSLERPEVFEEMSASAWPLLSAKRAKKER